MTSADIDDAVRGFAAAARRARDAGFDGVELHGANGYLLDQFLTPATNHRDDAYGGDVAGRTRIIAEAVAAVRAAVGDTIAVGLRLSQGKVNDLTAKWREDEAADLLAALGALPLDYLHVTEFEAWAPAFRTGASLVELARRHGGRPVIANGSLHDAARAAAMLEDADVVALGRGAIANPDWPRRVRGGVALQPFDKAILSPLADLATADRRLRDFQGSIRALPDFCAPESRRRAAK